MPDRLGSVGLVRAPLSAIAQAKALKRAKRVYLALHPETKRGGAPGAGRGKAPKNVKITSFGEDAAAKTGKSRSTVEQAVALAESIPDDVADAIEGTPGTHLDSRAPRINPYRHGRGFELVPRVPGPPSPDGGQAPECPRNAWGVGRPMTPGTPQGRKLGPQNMLPTPGRWEGKRVARPARASCALPASDNLRRRLRRSSSSAT